MYLKAYINQLRIKNWLKNVFVFIPLVFALSLTDADKLMATALAFVAFCLVSSAVYIFNDILDVDVDRQHPTKKNRPIASGVISVKSAAAIAVLLLCTAMGFAVWANWLTAVILAMYVAENVIYSIWLKHLPILDCFCIAAGFIFRVYAGGFACGEMISDWLFLTIIAMSLFMSFGKRRGEMLKVDADSQRAVLEHYDLAFLNGMVFVCAGLSIVFYALWSMFRGMYMIYTVPVIIFIVCEYLLLVHNEKCHGDPTTVIFSSRILIAACVVYAVITVALLYAGR